MQPAAEGCASREEALAKVRALAAEHRSAFERLGATPDIDAGESVVEWQDEWGTPLAVFVPLAPSLLRAGVARLAEVEQELDAELGRLAADDWDRRDGPDGWSVRMVVDHLAAGSVLFTLRVEIWPLEADEAQRGALDELIARVELVEGTRTALDHFGWNVENGRVRWTPRKIVRVTRGRQDAWLEHASGGPRPPDIASHADVDGDDEPADARELVALRERDVELRRVAREHPSVRGIAFWYRYYRDRLTAWPSGELERWRAMRAAFRERLLSYDEHELASVRVAPNGACTSVRQQLGLALAHIPEHRAQIEQIRAAAEARPGGIAPGV